MSRGRLNQGTVLPGRGGDVPLQATVRRWGGSKGFEGRMEKLLGRDCLESVLHSSYGVKMPVPVVGLPFYVCDGMVLPVIAGGAGFYSLTDFRDKANRLGRKQEFFFLKSGVVADVVGAAQHFWNQTFMPIAGNNPAAPPGGTAYDNTSQGGFQQKNAASGETLHLAGGMMRTSSVGGAVLFYDRLWGVLIDTATTANTVTGVPTRYQSTNAAGSWISARVGTILAATAHNVTITYVDENGNAAEAGAALAARVSSNPETIPITGPAWQYPLNSPDKGVRNITSIALSAASTGTYDWHIGHSLFVFPTPLGSVITTIDGINNAFSLVQIIDGTCIAMMEFSKLATGNQGYHGILTLVSG